MSSLILGPQKLFGLLELDLQGALQRIRGPRRGTDLDEEALQPETASPDGGTPIPNGVVSGAEVPEL